jgi:hypothetical protein
VLPCSHFPIGNDPRPSRAPSLHDHSVPICLPALYFLPIQAILGDLIPGESQLKAVFPLPIAMNPQALSDPSLHDGVPIYLSALSSPILVT